MRIYALLAFLPLALSPISTRAVDTFSVSAADCAKAYASGEIWTNDPKLQKKNDGAKEKEKIQELFLKIRKSLSTPAIAGQARWLAIPGHAEAVRTYSLKEIEDEERNAHCFEFLHSSAFSGKDSRPHYAVYYEGKEPLPPAKESRIVSLLQSCVPAGKELGAITAASIVEVPDPVEAPYVLIQHVLFHRTRGYKAPPGVPTSCFLASPK